MLLDLVGSVVKTCVLLYYYLLLMYSPKYAPLSFFNSYSSNSEIAHEDRRNYEAPLQNRAKG